MSCSSRNPIAVSISLQYFKKQNMHFIVTKWSLSIIQMSNETTIMESHCIDEA
jgi:hypothetical protein